MAAAVTPARGAAITDTSWPRRAAGVASLGSEAREVAIRLRNINQLHSVNRLHSPSLPRKLPSLQPAARVAVSWSLAD